ncbi:aspartate kinase [Streptomyces sp. NPDC047928]|uniref:aspartate kinase n=1 Tax=unclassified Streptomyces TaxID=2593676 RepID=UPI0037108A7E
MNATNGTVVQKYGGSSLSTYDKVNRVAGFAAASHRAGRPTAVVVSARGDTTDDLLRAVDEVSGEVRGDGVAREIDQLLATGENASAALVALAVCRLGVPAVSLTGAQAGMTGTGRHGAGVITGIDTGRVRSLLRQGRVVIVAGFQAANEEGDTLTLGRGGSDTTAVALAAALDAAECEIYTDVDGVYSADPRIVPAARRLPEVDLSTMAELAFAGARVLHSRAVELAALRDVRLRVLSAFERGPGTVVMNRAGDAVLESQGAVIAVAHDFDVARVLVHSRSGTADAAAEVLEVLARHSVPLDMVARSGPFEDEFRMGFTIRRSDVEAIRAPLAKAAAELGGGVRVDEELAKVSLVGTGLLNRPEHVARMVSVLAAESVSTSWISTSQLRASVIVPRTRALHAVEVLHRAFGLERDGLLSA